MSTQQNPQMRIEKVNLTASVGLNYLLKDISFDIFVGDRIAIIGASGAGKTSLLRLLNRLTEPTSGSIYLEEKDYRQIPVIPLRRQIMLVPQEAKLLGMTVREALAYPLVLQQQPKSIIDQRIITWIELLRIPEDLLDRTEVQLSQGQKQLVAIARALLTQPKILLLDEPTSALDIGRASHLLNVLSELAQNSETTILMVNHQLNLAQKFCKRLLYLEEGKLIQDLEANQVDWEEIHTRLIQAEAKLAKEWE